MAGFCLDSAMDNISTYKLLHDKGIEAFIELNGKEDEAVPKCTAGLEMKYSGFENARNRHKWACPCPKGASECPLGQSCTSSRLGAVRHTSPSDDLRMYPRTPRSTKKWKEAYKNRSPSERMNNRFLNDYGLSRIRMKLQRRYAFFTMLIGINIHLDSWVKMASA